MIAPDDTEVVRIGRLFKFRLERSAEARADALASIRQRPDGQWQARIGGRMRGKTETFVSRKRAEAAVKRHYDLALWLTIQQERRSATK